jgi:hypothetical protein
VAFVQRLTHLSKLAFFLSLGVVATIVDACGGESESGNKDPGPSTGGGVSDAKGGASATGGNSSNSGGVTAAGGNFGGSAATGGSSTVEIPDAGAGLWDVICE